MKSKVQFPDSFLWGCSTAAYQVEGSSMADGAGPSIWDRFTRIPGKVHNGDTGDVACDHYNRWREDVQLMSDLGLKSYRFSISWSRIFPNGKGEVNKKGLEWYSNLVDALLAKNIQPMVTLYHWDLPQALDELGGWLNPDIVQWFGDYAETVFKHLDGRVQMWATINEPWVVTDGGYMHGALAPGHKSHYEAAIAAHRLMQCNAEAIRRYRKVGKHQIGLVVNLEPKYPASQSPEDLAANNRADAYMNRQFMDPAFFGTYPKELKEEIFGDAWPEWPKHEMDALKEKMDFLGINYYTRSVTRNAPEAWPVKAAAVRQPLATYSETGWETFPQGLRDILNWVRTRYGNPPVYITENGSAFFDPPVAENGRVDDPLRQSYMRKHIRAVSDAIADGCDIRGYYTWSLLDNLEWALGYSKRFGIVHVNYDTLERTPKESAKLYSRIIETNGALLGDNV